MKTRATSVLIAVSMGQAFAGNEKILIRFGDPINQKPFVYIYNYTFQEKKLTSRDLVEALRHIKNLVGKKISAQLESNQSTYYSGQVISSEEPAPKRVQPNY